MEKRPKSLVSLGKSIDVKELNILRYQAFYKEAYGKLIGRAVNHFYSTQPQGNENYGDFNNKIGMVYLYQDRMMLPKKGTPEHDATIELLDSDRRISTVCAIDLEKDIWYKASSIWAGRDWNSFPEDLKRDTKNLMNILKLKENELIK